MLPRLRILINLATLLRVDCCLHRTIHPICVTEIICCWRVLFCRELPIYAWLQYHYESRRDLDRLRNPDSWRRCYSVRLTAVTLVNHEENTYLCVDENPTFLYLAANEPIVLNQPFLRCISSSSLRYDCVIQYISVHLFRTQSLQTSLHSALTAARADTTRETLTPSMLSPGICDKHWFCEVYRKNIRWGIRAKMALYVSALCSICPRVEFLFIAVP